MGVDFATSNAALMDAKLGYRIPRLWFPQAQPGCTGEESPERWSAAGDVAMPRPRNRPSSGAYRPVGSDAVVQEYQQMQAFRAYR